ncbi:UDP-N-acetylmuramoylalanine-D-glutamate ligase [Peptoniphilus sp. ING2-D1G]|nr:UDP-N-acetylmuramoylalanine-D-glutamate ligase [Peptoniphilus sp. ING2-D1G]
MYENKNILILGFGITGRSALKCLSNFNVNIYIYDENIESLKKYSDYIFKIYKSSDLKSIDFIVKSPGIKPDHPILTEAEKNKIVVKSDLEVFYEICKCKNLIAITGTNGKTTTSSLVENILKEKYKTYLVGNIGKSVFDVALEAKEEECVVIEASSFQLEYVNKFRPKISIITNITSDHLDWHKTVQNYKNAKYKIFANQSSEDFIIINENSELKYKSISPKKYFFSTEKVVDRGIFLKDNAIYFKDEDEIDKIIDISEIKIPGKHNIENIMCAINVAKVLNVPKNMIYKSVRNFMGVEHRIEFVRELRGVKYYNDSKGTNPDSTIMAIKAMDDNIILIAGGYDKGADFDNMLDMAKKKIKTMVLFGQTADKIQAVAKKYGIKMYIVKNMEQAVELSYSIAETEDIVLLSPACASWDMYESYEKRGEHFKKLVNELI